MAVVRAVGAKVTPISREVLAAVALQIVPPVGAADPLVIRLTHENAVQIAGVESRPRSSRIAGTKENGNLLVDNAALLQGRIRNLAVRIQAALVDIRQEPGQPTPGVRIHAAAVDALKLVERDALLRVMESVDCQRDLLQVVRALGPTRRFPNALHRGNEQRNKNRDDGEHHEHFDQGEADALMPLIHGHVSSPSIKTPNSPPRTSLRRWRENKPRWRRESSARMRAAAR